MVLSKSNRINIALEKMKIFSYKDVLFHFPYRYDDLSITHEINLNDKEHVVFLAKIASEFSEQNINGKSLIKFDIVTPTGNKFSVNAWNRNYLNKAFHYASEVTISGVYDKRRNVINLVSIYKGKVDESKTLKPVYSLPQTLSNLDFVKLVDKAFKNIDPNQLNSDIPAEYNCKYQLLPTLEALELIHHPKNKEEIYKGLRGFKYEECLHFSVKSKLIREENASLTYLEKCPINLEASRNFIRYLPFKLSQDQKVAVREIVFDMNKQNLMYRLLQGDVGTGKTLVAEIALFANFTRGDQGVFMAPTDALAKQHYANLVKIFSPFNVKVALLSGNTSLKERSAIRNALMNKQIDILVGTHILFSKDINYISLGLVIIDEQHKFGVNQRMQLLNKGDRADLLLMSATPIPRTLALTFYGDLDISTLTSFPLGEHHIDTKIVKSDDALLISEIKNSLSNNKRVYIVAPKIAGEISSYSVENLYSYYLKLFPGKVALLHGELDQDEKDFALKDFYSGNCPIIISTSVIEVGIDVKEANLMIVYDANHFGLSSLHQLRGRIGRDGSNAKCFLVYDEDDLDAYKRLNVLVKSNDGFYIAEEDLRRRGAGELAGIKQSGRDNFTFVNLVEDFKIFEIARKDSLNILAHRNLDVYKDYVKKIEQEIENDKFKKQLD